MHIPKVVIFTGKVHSGKSTALEILAGGRQDITGVLCPEIHGKKSIIFLPERHHHLLEVDANSLCAITVGNYVLDGQLLQKVSQFISEISVDKWRLIVIDEVGKLELENRGYEPGLSALIHAFQQYASDAILLLVVRDTLVDRVVTKYVLNAPNIVSNAEDLQAFFEDKLH